MKNNYLNLMTIMLSLILLQATKLLADKPKLKTVYIQGIEKEQSQKDKCHTKIGVIEEALKAQKEPYKIYDGCKHGLSLYSFAPDLMEQVDSKTTIYLNAHGLRIRSISLSGSDAIRHDIQISSTFGDPTNYVFDFLSKINKPLHVELYSCYSGQAIDDVYALPLGSSLVTHSSSGATALAELNDEEFFVSIKEREDNPFSSYALTILLSAEQNSGLSVRTDLGVKKFTAQLPSGLCSQQAIVSWQKSEIERLKKFYGELKEESLPEEVKEQISNAIAFIEDGQKINRIQLEYLSRSQELSLLSSAHKNDLAQVKCLLAFGSEARTTHGNTALQIASHRGLEKMVSLLIDSGADLDSADENGLTSLMSACVFKYLVIVRKLLAAGADVNKATKTKEGSTPLLLSVCLPSSPASEDEISVVRLLIENNAIVSERAKECIHQNMPILDELVARKLYGFGIHKRMSELYKLLASKLGWMGEEL